MLYQALYRKYRPKTFDEIMGQQVIVKTLKNIIKNQKLTHAYLFIGPRGTGKTSVAKIFAKTINCENPKNGVSCEKCNICINNNENENIDIIEMDAASNNGVDEIREIKNHTTLLPTMSKYKVYIIDEVHMLTTGAFNALLKTLEEPPKHVIFILATTEPHKIPLTIMSRCQSFEFKPISKDVMKERLKYICENEKITITEDALDEIAFNSSGGMRDAISLLDQLNAYTDSNITKADVILLSGRISEDEIQILFKNIIQNKIKECFNVIDEFEKNGKDFSYICEDIIKYLRDNYLEYQIKGKSNIIEQLGVFKITNIIMLFNKCITDMKNSKDKRVLFELIIIQLINMYSTNQTNVCNIESQSTEKKVTLEKPKQKSLQNDDMHKLYEELMNIRMNNILAKADKKSLENYKLIFSKLENNITDLQYLKMINILSDCTIKAGCPDGVILTTDNESILNELYDNLNDIEEILLKEIKSNIKICILLDSYWLVKREEYINKIKNKEEILILDEQSIVSSINEKLKKESKNEFEDLLEIGDF